MSLKDHEYNKVLPQSEETIYMTDGEFLYRHVGFNQYQVIGRHFKGEIECIHLRRGGDGLKPYKSELKDEGNWYESHGDHYEDMRTKTGYY